MTGSTPNWLTGYVPPATEWNALWAGKADYGGSASFTTLILTNLPTSSSGLPTGALWNNGGVLCVV